MNTTITGEIVRIELKSRKPYDRFIGRYDSMPTEYDEFYADVEVLTEAGSVYFKSPVILRRVTGAYGGPRPIAIVTFRKDETDFLKVVGDDAIAEPGKPNNNRVELKHKVGDVLTITGRVKADTVSRKGKPYRVLTHVKLETDIGYAVGQVIDLDCGYGGPDSQACKILALRESKNVFGEPRVAADVEIVSTGERFTADLPKVPALA